MYSVLKKVLEYRYPLYRSTGTRFKKLFLSIVFTILKKSYFLNIQPVHDSCFGCKRSRVRFPAEPCFFYILLFLRLFTADQRSQPKKKTQPSEILSFTGVDLYRSIRLSESEVRRAAYACGSVLSTDPHGFQTFVPNKIMNLYLN